MSGNLQGIIALCVWSFSALLVSFSGHAPPFLTAAICFFISFAFNATKWIMTKESVRDIFRQSPWAYIVCVGGLTGYFAAYNVALKVAPIIEANLINYLWPLSIVVLSAVVNKTRISAETGIGILTSFTGMVFVLSGKGEFNFGQNGFIIYIPAFMAVLFYAFYCVFTKIVSFPSSFIGGCYLIGGIILLSIHLGFESPYAFKISEAIPIFLLGASTTSYTLWDRAMKTGDPIMLASLAYLVPLFSTLWLILCGRGDWSVSILIGGAMIVAGGIIANVKKIKNLRQSY
jgi:drug/metabolite transporter (DMT)-like permease